MPDVTMCDSEKCPLAKRCYYNPRSGTKPSEWRQSWFFLGQQNSPTETEDCEHFSERNFLTFAHYAIRPRAYMEKNK